MIRVTVLSLVMLIATPTLAAGPIAPDNYVQAIVNYAVKQFPLLDGPSASCPVDGVANKPLGSPACVNAYKKLYRTDTLDIRAFFGYSNSEANPGVPATDLVFDSYLKASFVEQLMKPCIPNLFACGFLRDPDDADILYREVQGPDGKSKKVKLRLESSSVSESDSANEHSLKSDQKKQSAHIEHDFLDALANANVVLYEGHARHASGPGFKPLPIPHWSWLDAVLFRPSRREMLAKLKKSKNPAALVGINACDSDHYYRAALQKASPELGIVVAEGDAIYEEAQASTLGTINAVLGLKCKEDFEKSLTKSKLYGFFGTSPGSGNPAAGQVH